MTCLRYKSLLRNPVLFVLKDIWSSSTNCSTTETRRFSKPAAGIWPTGICTAWASRDWQTRSVFRYWDASHSALKQGAVNAHTMGGTWEGVKGTFCPFSTYRVSTWCCFPWEMCLQNHTDSNWQHCKLKKCTARYYRQKHQFSACFVSNCQLSDQCYFSTTEILL